MTNGERIRKAETDKQIAEFLFERIPNACPPLMICRNVNNDCLKCWRIWLAREEEK